MSMPADTRDVFAWRKRDANKPPPLLRYRSAEWFILSTICFAIFTDLFLYGIIVPVIPFALSERAGVPAQDVQHWVSVLLAVYGAALLAASPFCGWLADRSESRRLPLLIGLLALGGATIMLCLGTSIALIVTGRVLQGLAAAIVWCVGLALLVDTVGHEEIGKIMGYVTLSMSLAIILAPLLGGIVYARAGYYAVFYMAFGLIATDIIMRIALIEKKMAKKWGLAVKELDPEAIHSSPTPPVSSFEVVTASSPTSKSPVPALETAIAFTPDLPFFKTSSLPPVLTLLSSYRLLTALWGVLVEAALLTAFDSVIPLRVRHLFSWNSTGAGLIFLALILPTFISPIIGALSDKYGPRWFTFAGFLASAPCLILLRFVDHSGVKQIVLLCALLALLGLALTMLVTPLLAEITYVVAAREKMQPGVFGAKGAYAQAFGLFNSAFAAGTLVGPIWAGFVSEKAGWVTMGWSLGLLSAVSAVPVLFFTGGPLIIRNRRQTPDPRL